MDDRLRTVCTFPIHYTNVIACRSAACAVMADGRKLRQQEFQEKRELLEFTESQLNQLTYEMKEEIRQYSEEVERKVRWLLMLLDSLILVSSS